MIKQQLQVAHFFGIGNLAIDVESGIIDKSDSGGLSFNYTTFKI